MEDWFTESEAVCGSGSSCKVEIHGCAVGDVEGGRTSENSEKEKESMKSDGRIGAKVCKLVESDSQSIGGSVYQVGRMEGGGRHGRWVKRYVDRIEPSVE